jgi:3-deoxy-D-manno-octulosonic-acid transferase
LPAECQVLLVDTLGELVDFYAAADVAFVGGSLVPVGGHNLLEPAALGLPLLAGPYQSASPQVARALLEAGALEIVGDAAQLAARLQGLIEAPALRAAQGERARAALESHRGALQRLLSLIGQLPRPP